MEQINYWDIMTGSIGENLFIIIAAVFAVTFLAVSVILAWIIHKDFESDGGKNLKNKMYYLLDIIYTLFVTIISIFPLLGMFGTVAALLSLDMSGDLSEIRNNFFFALTSTAWGIIFSIGGKIINALCQPFIENQIARAKKILKK